jgi:hypothetical protein
MAMGLRVAPTAFIVLLAFAVEDDYMACTSGSSCAAWKALVEGPAKIVIQDEEHGEDVQYYRMDVIHADGVTYFSKLRRYSEFVNLRKSLGLGDGDGAAARDVAPFPPKLYLNAIAQKLWPSTMEDRRAQLEVWLQKVIAHENSTGPWADYLFAFLDPKHSAATFSSGISMPPDANKICRTLTWPVTNDKHYFGIDVNNGGEKPDRVWRRFSDFHALNETLSTLKEDDIEALGAFPEKLYWNHLIPVWESKLEERRRGLEAWLQKAKLHPNSALGGLWADELNKFLDPAGTEKLEEDCYLEKMGQTTYTELEKLYSNVKDKIDELSESMKGTGTTQEGNKARQEKDKSEF